MPQFNPAAMLTTTAIVLFPVLATDARAQLLLEVDGVELHGRARLVMSGAGSCNVLETDTSYEEYKANHGAPMDVWRLDFSVRNGSGRWLDHLIAHFGIDSAWPDCTNWSGPDVVQLRALNPEVPLMDTTVAWAGTIGRIQESGRNVVAPGQTLTDTEFFIVLRGDPDPRFVNWSMDFDFAAAPPPAGAGSPAAAPAQQPTPAAPAELDGLFWQSIVNSTNPAMFEAYLAQFPSGVFRALAEARLTELRAPATNVPAAAGSRRADARLIIDLADKDKKRSLPVNAGTYTVQLINTIPGEPYAVSVGASTLLEQPSLLVPSSATMKGGLQGNVLRAVDSCQRAHSAVKRLYDGPEEEIPKLRRQVNAALISCDKQAVKVAITSIIDQTTVAVDDLTVTVPAEARIPVVVSSGGSTWQLTLTSVSRGRWQTMFGWVFSPDRDEEYFAESLEDGSFTVRRRERRERSLTSLPAVFWTWLPADQAFRAFQHGPTAGLGVTVGETSARPSVFGGYSLRYNQNIGVVVGVAFYSHKRLDSRYSVDQVIKENLESEQLNRGSIRPNVFFGLTLRFGSDPRTVPEEARGDSR